MTLEEAASALRARLHDAPWLTGVGVGERDGRPCIFLYVKSPKREELGFLEDGWHGYGVEVRRMGTPRLAVGSRSVAAGAAPKRSGRGRER
jgi:hypothetical protein